MIKQILCNFYRCPHAIYGARLASAAVGGENMGLHLFFLFLKLDCAHRTFIYAGTTADAQLFVHFRILPVAWGDIKKLRRKVHLALESVQHELRSIWVT